MALVNVTPENIAQEHICCAITEKKGETCVADKKAWMAERFASGLTFVKLDQRGKVFIEYIPAESAWAPVLAEGYMHINCFWVSGKFKGQGHANQLLDTCIADAKQKGKKGLTILAAAKKKPFLADGAYLRHKGFRLADTATPFFELLYLPFAENAPLPAFTPAAKLGETTEKGLVLYYSAQCPHAGKYADIFATMAKAAGKPLTLHRLTTTEEARAVPAAATSYALFKDGKFYTNEILSEKKIAALLAE